MLITVVVIQLYVHHDQYITDHCISRTTIKLHPCQTSPYPIGGVYFPERNGNGTEVAVVAYLDCIHDRVSIILLAW